MLKNPSADFVRHLPSKMRGGKYYFYVTGINKTLLYKT
jgi:hypothetical protein